MNIRLKAFLPLLLFIVCSITQLAGPSSALANYMVFTDSGQSIGNENSRDVALGDLDGDGDIDAFVANFGANKVWLNDGSGAFTNSGQSLGSSNSLGVALGDLDGDGDLDAFVANNGADKVWLNDGSGWFSSSGQSFNAMYSKGVALGDFNGDGYLDAFVVNHAQPSQIWTNNGSGSFSVSQTLSLMLNNGVALGDLDGDDDLDAFVASNACNKVFLYEYGNFTATTQFFIEEGQTIALGDLDGDGDLDAFVVADIGIDKVWLNNGSGTFTNSGQSLGYAFDVALGDLDGDGDLDAFAANWADPNIVWLNNGSGGFTSSGLSLGISNSSGVALGDLDGDGDLDAFVANYGQSNKVWLNQSVQYGSIDQSLRIWNYNSTYPEGDSEIVEFTASAGEDKLLHVAGYDVDTVGELAVMVNDVLLGFLPTGSNEDLTVDTIWWLPSSLLNSGTNEISFIQNTSGEKWGFSRIGIYNAGVAFGNITGGDTEHPDGFELHFPATGASLLSVQGWDMDWDGETAFNLNGQDIFGIPMSGNNAWGAAYQYYLPGDLIVDGDNVLTVQNDTSGTQEWGVALNGLSNALTAPTGLTNGLTYLVPVMNVPASLYLRFSDIDATEGIAVSKNGSFISYAPQTDAGLLSGRYRVNLAADALAEIDIVNTTAYDTWSVSIEKMTYQYIDAGYAQSFLFNSAAEIIASGNNLPGMFGNGTWTSSSSPVDTGVTNMVSISAGGTHILGIDDQGFAWAWGRNGYGELGINNTLDKNTPQMIPGISNVVSVSTKVFSSLALDADGNVWMWGQTTTVNEFGAIDYSIVPILYNTAAGPTDPVEIVDTWTRIAVLNSDGAVWVTRKTAPFIFNPSLLGMYDIVALRSGTYSIFGIDKDGDLWGFGENEQGQIGVGNTTNVLTPQEISGISNVVDVDGGRYHTIALDADGAVWAWGGDEYGQIGVANSTSNQLTPQKVPYFVDNAITIIDIAANGLFSMAMDNFGNVWTWGQNNKGQLGIGNTTDMDTPTLSDFKYWGQ